MKFGVPVEAEQMLVCWSKWFLSYKVVTFWNGLWLVYVRKVIHK